MKIGDAVIFTELGKKYLATVLGVRELDHHSGKNGEPLLHLGFFAPVLKPGPDGKPVEAVLVGTHAQTDLVQFRLDVAHESHEFPEKLKQPKYPGGRWNSVDVVEERSAELAVIDPQDGEPTDKEGESDGQQLDGSDAPEGSVN